MTNEKLAEIRGYQDTLLMLALNHNASVIELASSMIAASPLKKHHYERALKQFKSLHTDYVKEYKEILAHVEKELDDGR
jgi:hypothetical protein